MYLVTMPWYLQALYPSLTWKKKGGDKTLYLTFDDGPHETATPYVLDQLRKYNAAATFFCIGKNVVAHRAIYDRVVAEGHAVGNHTYNHVNGWKTVAADYVTDIAQAQQEIGTSLFRPPYGRITRKQIRLLQGAAMSGQLPAVSYELSAVRGKELPSDIIMWHVLSGDFDLQLSKEQCAANVIDHAVDGSIVVFHDSTKAWERMSYALPKVLEHFSKQGYTFKAL